MIVQIERLILILCLFCLPFQGVYSQSFQSLDDYTGAWETSATWSPTWKVPQSEVNNHYIDIKGYITVYGSLSFSGSSKLTISDTLVIKGNLTINDNNKLKIRDNGILIIRGNLTISEDTEIEANGYIIVTGGIIKVGNINKGNFHSNDNPVKVFIGGTIPSGITNNNLEYKALNCTKPSTTPYPNSSCSHGNMIDIISDPIYLFFQSTCLIPTPTITADGPTTFCAGGSVTLTSNAGSRYLWSTGATSASINVATPGSYTVQVTNEDGCQSAPSVATIVTVNALPVTPTITAGGPTTFCEGGSVTLASSKGSSYLWSTGATTSNINVAAAGSYTVKVTNGSACQSALSVATIVTVNTLPAIPVIKASGPTTLCSGGSVTLTSSEGSNYIWSTGATTSGINVTTGGNYTVQVTDANGCQSAASAATVVTINALPEVDAGSDVTIPNGTSTSINATVTGTGPFTYSWSPSGQLVNALIEVPTTINLLATTIFTLTATSTTTSCFNTDEVTISISGGPLGSQPKAAPETVCAGSKVQLYATASGGSGSYTYIWTATPSGFTSVVANPIANPSVSTTYNVAVNDGFTTVNAQIAVTVNPLPVTPIIVATGPIIFCAGGSVTLTSSTGSTYLWSTGETTQSINAATAGSYTVRVTNAGGCLSAASTATLVPVNAIPITPTITSGGPTTFCAGGSVTLTSSAGSTYLWSTGETTQSINVHKSGSYTVHVANTSGCRSASSVATIVTINTLPETPTITASGPTTFCSGGSVILTSSAGSTYLWSTGETTPSINVDKSGSYTVQVINVNGCKSASSLATLIEVNSLPLVKIISSDLSMCVNDQRILTGSPVGGTFSISDGPGAISGSILSATGIGNIILVYNYSNVCPNNDTQIIIVNPTPVANAGSDQELHSVFESQMNAELSSSETGEWSLISGSGHISDIHSPTTMVTGLSFGENIFLWKVRNGNCEAEAKVKITVFDLFVPSVITPDGDGKNDNFKISEFPGKVELIIFNRWGNVEYTNNNYLNDWDGRNNKGSELPNDTYFYVLTLENGIIKKGSVLIIR